MKVKFNIDNQLAGESAEFWLKKMTNKFSQLGKELSGEQDTIWCSYDDEIIPVKFENIYLIQVEQEQTLIYDKTQSYRYKGQSYQVKNILPHNFLIASRSAIINYQKIDHLEVMDGGNIDVIMKNQMRVQISRRKIKDLKERLGL
ncbi:LytTR family DNA-binding domain-containing protein [Lactobacillus crispatus]|uniref:LytTR family DNA-binding domain-containing protein n=1 Tax=Lactobacillus crispatus TaxID=47770 RepID=UPI001E4C0266|nr:LytTR family DNA-binding domain-containing protein [Lactobacillus crispatus]